MAETHAKHPREEPESSDFEPSSSKRQKPYNNILSFLEEEEEEEVEESAKQAPNQDLSAILTTLQRELSSSSEHSTTATFDSLPCTAEEDDELATVGGGGAEDEGVESVMRHLLEASDDELGIPNRGEDFTEVNSGENLPFAIIDIDGLWDLEDEAYGYLTVLQSELLM